MKHQQNPFVALVERARKHIAYKVEGATIEFTEELCKLMQHQGVNKTGLAQRLKCNPAFITKLLSGRNNFTIQTMVKTADALGAEVRIHLQPVGIRSYWVDEETFKTTTTVAAAAHEKFSIIDFKESRVTALAAPEQSPATQEQDKNAELAIAA